MQTKLICLIHGNTPDADHLFSVEIEKEMTVSRLNEVIIQEIIHDDKVEFKLWKVNINLNESNEKLSILFDNPDANVKKELGGEKLLVGTKKIAKCFTLNKKKKCIHIIIELPDRRLTLTSCTKREELVPMDRIIFKEGSIELEGEIVLTNIGIKIRFIRHDYEIMLDSFTQFIERVKRVKKIHFDEEKSTHIGESMSENLIIYLQASDERLPWSYFRNRVFNQRKHKVLKNITSQEKMKYLVDNAEQLGERKIFPVADLILYRKLVDAEHDFWREFEQGYKIRSVDSGLVDEKGAIIVNINQPRGSLLSFPLPTRFRGFPVFIGYDKVIPYHRNYHEELMPGISIGRLRGQPNACTLGLLIKIRSKPEGIFILTTKHGIGGKGDPICQPGKVDSVDHKCCATVTKCCALSIDKNERLIDYAICRISNNDRVPGNPNEPYKSGITVSSFKDSVSDNSDVIITKKVSRTTLITEGIMEDRWSEFISDAFDPPRKCYALKISNIKEPFAAPSGSPVFKDGQLAGILHGGTKDKSAAYVIPIHLIKEHAKRFHGVEFELMEGASVVEIGKKSLFDSIRDKVTDFLDYLEF